MIVVWLSLTVPRVCLQFVIMVFPDHTHYFPQRQKSDRPQCIFTFARLTMLQLTNILLFWCHLKVKRRHSLYVHYISSMFFKDDEVKAICKIFYHIFWTMEKLHFETFIKVYAVVYEECKVKYILKWVSFGNKDCTKELKLECAYFLGQTS